MYLIISGTNRKDSFTLRIAELYHTILKGKNREAPVLSLVGLDLLERNASVLQLEKKWLLPAEKYIFISPEYNGSIPGVLKCLIDVSDVKKVWKGKKGPAHRCFHRKGRKPAGHGPPDRHHALCGYGGTSEQTSYFHC